MKNPRILHPVESWLGVGTWEKQNKLFSVCVSCFDSFPNSLSFFFSANVYFKIVKCFVVGCTSGHKTNKEKV